MTSEENMALLASSVAAMEPAWLSRLCAPAGQDRRPWLQAPFLWPAADGSVWACATDSRLLLFWGRGHSEGIEPIAETNNVATIARYFAPWGPAVLTLPLDTLRAWCGPAVWEQPCPSCQGTAKASPHVHCSFCDGDGTMAPDAAPGWLCGETIDRNLLAKGLHYLPAGDVTIHTEGPAKPEDEGRVLWCLGDGWRLAIMGASLPTSSTAAREDYAAAPHLEAAPLPWEEYTCWLQAVAADPAAAPIFADWLEERGGAAWAEEVKRLRGKQPTSAEMR